MSLSASTAIPAQIAKLALLHVNDLRAEWARSFGKDPPKSAQREYLLRALTYELQCSRYGGLPAAVLRDLKKLDGSDVSKKPSDPTRTLSPGARMLREWKGAVHEVEVVEDGFLYKAKTYKSLSVIARRITGTRWSGPKFFGVKQSQLEAPNGLR